MKQFEQLPSAKGNATQHYANLSAWKPEGKWEEGAAAKHLGKWWEIDEAIYEEFLNMLPPIYVPGGFRMCEMLTDDISAYFFEAGGRWWCGETNSQRNTEEGAITPAMMNRHVYSCAINEAV